MSEPQGVTPAGQDAPRGGAPKQALLDPAGRRGRTLFFCGLLLYAAWELSVLGPEIYFESPRVMQSVVRVASGFVLFFFAWRGRLWATILITLAFSVACAAGWLMAIVRAPGWTGAVTTVVPTLLGLFGVALHAAPSLRSYLAFQRAND